VIGILTLIRYENIPYFSMRIWLYLTLLVLVYFIYKLVKTLAVDYKREKTNTQSHKTEQVKKPTVYLPNKK
ncbi:MAG: hypothetical protein WC269_06010, partial [Candidatus Gracilibacteria bacterium]